MEHSFQKETQVQYLCEHMIVCGTVMFSHSQIKSAQKLQKTISPIQPQVKELYINFTFE
jgi:hypothetical protein